MKISLFTDGIFPLHLGGMQKHSFYLAKYWAKRQIYVRVYYPIQYNEKEYNLEKLTTAFNPDELPFLEFVVVPFPKIFWFPGHYLLESYLYSVRLYKQYLLKEKDSDFVYIQGFSGWAFLKDPKSKTVLHCLNFHGLEMFQPQPQIRSRLESVLLSAFVKKQIKRSSYVQSLGGKLTDILNKLGITNDRIWNIGIGISREWLSDKANTTYRPKKLIYVGRNERRKGLDLLNIVLHRLHRFYPNLSFEIEFVGPIPEAKRINAAHIKYHGVVRDEKKLQSIYRQSDILVCPSLAEGMPTVILEAMATGCAIIASDVGAVSEQVNKENGRCIAPNNQDALYHAIVDFLSMDDESINNMKKVSLSKAESLFLWDKVIDQTIQQIKASLYSQGL